MDKLKVLDATRDLKVFFEKRKVKISEAKEIMFRLLDYIDTHYDEEQREVPFRNGNGLNGLNGNIKEQTSDKKIKLEVKAR